MSDEYEVYAIKYAHHDRPAHENFLGGDLHDDNMPLDYFVWAIIGEKRTFVVDMGFDAEKGRQRGRTMIRPPEAGLKALGLDPDGIEDVIVTHMHYDHAGNTTSFPNARFHLQDREMAYCTGRCMCHTALSQVFEADDVTAMIRRVFEGRVEFHDGSSIIAPGISVHLVGGHSNGLQAVRVRTRRGWVVLASDASHFYANIDQRRPFPVVYNVGDMIEGWKTIEKLADSPDHIIPGHDPAVLQNFPAANPGLEDWIVRLDADPVRTRQV